MQLTFDQCMAGQVHPDGLSRKQILHAESHEGRARSMPATMCTEVAGGLGERHHTWDPQADELGGGRRTRRRSPRRSGGGTSRRRFGGALKAAKAQENVLKYVRDEQECVQQRREVKMRRPAAYNEVSSLI